MNCPNLKNDWFFPDAYLPNPQDGVSHEAVCILNLGDADAVVEMTLYFEDAACMKGFRAVCPAQRTKHIRLDKIRSEEGAPIPTDRPYALWVHSSEKVLCQYTRVDASVPPRTMISAMGL